MVVALVDVARVGLGRGGSDALGRAVRAGLGPQSVHGHICAAESRTRIGDERLNTSGSTLWRRRTVVLVGAWSETSLEGEDAAERRIATVHVSILLRDLARHGGGEE